MSSRFLSGATRILSQQIIDQANNAYRPRLNPKSSCCRRETEFAAEVQENWLGKLLAVEMDTSIADPWGIGDVQAGSTDVGDVSWNAPTMEFSTAAFPLGTSDHAWQNVASSKVGIGHKSLIFAAKVIAATALDLMTNPESLSRVDKEFKELTKNSRYVSPLPDALKPPLNQLLPTPTKHFLGVHWSLSAFSSLDSADDIRYARSVGQQV